MRRVVRVFGTVEVIGTGASVHGIAFYLFRRTHHFPS
jgi:hypothetical protein